MVDLGVFIVYIYIYPCYIRLQTFFVFVKNANVWILYITVYVHIDMNYPLIASVFDPHLQ